MDPEAEAALDNIIAVHGDAAAAGDKGAKGIVTAALEVKVIYERLNGLARSPKP
jgi:hypothetical protein